MQRYNVEVMLYGQWRVLAEDLSPASANRIIAYGQSTPPTIPICRKLISN